MLCDDLEEQIDYLTNFQRFKTRFQLVVYFEKLFGRQCSDFVLLNNVFKQVKYQVLNFLLNNFKLQEEVQNILNKTKVIKKKLKNKITKFRSFLNNTHFFTFDLYQIEYLFSEFIGSDQSILDSHVLSQVEFKSFVKLSLNKILMEV